MKYDLESQDALKRSACGKQEFKEKHLQKDKHEK